MAHRFQPGQSVRLRTGLFNRSAAGGDYKVVRELPENGGELSPHQERSRGARARGE